MFTTILSSAFYSALVAAAPKPSTGQENNPFLPKSLQDSNGVKPTNHPLSEKGKVGRQLLTPKAKEVEKYNPDSKALRNTIPETPAVEVIPDDLFDPINELGLLANVPGESEASAGKSSTNATSIGRELFNCGGSYPVISLSGLNYPYDFYFLIKACYEDGVPTGSCPINGPIECWDVSGVTSFARAFRNVRNFNKDISLWNTGSAIDMKFMFFQSDFNQDISDWNVSKVSNMYAMFSYAYSFNQDISDWNVSKVTDMNNMFREANNFNEKLDNWDVGNVTNMSVMFFRSAFNAPIDEWDVGKVSTMVAMFLETPFNQCLSSWAYKVSDNVDTQYMFGNYEYFGDSTCTDLSDPKPNESAPWCQTEIDGCGVVASSAPSRTPSAVPSSTPSTSPSAGPSGSPSGLPSSAPSGTPSAVPSSTPSTSPSAGPSGSPSGLPSSAPSGTPSAVPSSTPSTSPSAGPSGSPSGLPSSAPSRTPSAVPSSTPSTSPSAGPTESPTESCENNLGTFKFQGAKVSCVDLLSLDESDLDERCSKSKYLSNCPEICNSSCISCENKPGTFQFQGVTVSCPDLFNERCSNSKYLSNCPENCNPRCISCENNPGTFKFKGVQVSCVNLLSLDESDLDERCSKSKFRSNCPENCNPFCATQSPTVSPSSIPSAAPSISCENNPGTFKFQGAKVSCVDLLFLDESELNETCSKSKYFNNCPANCNLQCVDCENNQQPFFSNGSLTTCREIAALDQDDRIKRCENIRVKDNCPGACLQIFCPLV